MKIIWNSYIKEQLSWAEKLSALSHERTDEEALTLQKYARRAVSNAHGAIQQQLGPSM